MALLVALGLGVDGAAQAGEDESALSVSLGWATYATPGDDGMTTHPSFGGALGVTYERGISEALSWRVAVAGGGFTGNGGAGAGWVSGGVVYRFDVLKYVPYALVAVGGVGLDGGDLPAGFSPMLELGGGLDVLTSRDRSWGIEARLGSFAGDTTIFSITARRTWRWGYF